MGHVEEGGIQVHETCRHRLRCAGYRTTVKTAVISPGRWLNWSFYPRQAAYSAYLARHTVYWETHIDQTPVEMVVFEIPHALLIEQ